jgi:hypothetical protein
MMETFQASFKNNNWTSSLPVHFDSDSTLLIIYFASKFSTHDMWKEIKTSFPKAKIIGCSGAGEVRSAEITDDEIIVTGIKFAKTTLHFSSIKDIKGKSSEEVGKNLASDFPKNNLKGLYLLSDGLSVNGTALIKGIKDVLGQEIHLSGGLAGDGANFKNTFVLVDGVPAENAVTAVGFYGEHIQICASADGGWIPFGVERKITKSEANVLFELDGKPALELYKEFLGEQAKKLPASALLFPIYLKTGTHQENRNAVRTILAVDETNQSMTFAGDVPEGTSIQLMRAGHENLVEAAKNVSIVNKMKTQSDGPTVSLIVSCVGRRLVLGENTENEVETVLENLPSNTVQTGFYSYGEIAPGKSGFCDLHNQTMTVTLIQEKG